MTYLSTYLPPSLPVHTVRYCQTEWTMRDVLAGALRTSQTNNIWVESIGASRHTRGLDVCGRQRQAGSRVHMGNAQRKCAACKG